MRGLTDWELIGNQLGVLSVRFVPRRVIRASNLLEWNRRVCDSRVVGSAHRVALDDRARRRRTFAVEGSDQLRGHVEEATVTRLRLIQGKGILGRSYNTPASRSFHRHGVKEPCARPTARARVLSRADPGARHRLLR